jgi:hypothetical protein
MLSQERARFSRLRRLLARVSREPCAACRLLQSKRSLSTAARSIEPRSPRPGSPPSAAPDKPPRPLAQPQNNLPDGWPSPFRSSASRESQVKDKTIGGSIQLFVPSTTIARGERFLPNPISSDTFCRKPASIQGWRTLHREGPHHLNEELSRARRANLTCARLAVRAASRIPSRKVMRSAAPKVPSIE